MNLLPVRDASKPSVLPADEDDVQHDGRQEASLARIGPRFDFGAEGFELDSVSCGHVSADGEEASQVVRHREEVDCLCPPA